MSSIPERSGPPLLVFGPAPVAAGVLVVGAMLTLLSSWPDALAMLAQPLAVVAALCLAARRLGREIHRGSLEEDVLSGLLMLSFIPVINQLTGFGLAPIAWWAVIIGLVMESLVGAWGILLGVVVVMACALPASVIHPWAKALLAGPWSTAIWMALLAVCAMALIGRRGQDTANATDMTVMAKRMEKDAEDSGVFGAIYFLPAVAMIAWVALVTLAPPAGMDALTYHLGLPAQYLARGALTPPDGLIYYQYTQAGEMLALLGLVVDATGRASTVLLGLGLPLAAISAGRLAGELAMVSDKRSRASAALARVLAFAAVATLPVAVFTVAHGKTDALALALVLAGVRRAVTRASCPFRAAFLLGGAVAVKLTAAYVAFPALIWVVWRVRRHPRVVAAVLGLAALAPAYWLGRNLMLTGSPFPQAHYLAAVIKAGASGSVGASIAERVLRLFGASLLFVSQGIDGPMGPVVISLAVLAFAGLCARRQLAYRRHLKAASGIAVVAVMLWLMTGGGSHAYAAGGLLRFLLPAFGVAAAAGAALAAELILPRGGHTRSGAFLGALFALGLVANLLAAGSVLARSMPAVDYLSGRIDTPEYLRGWLSTYELQRRADLMLPRDAVVAGVGESRLFYLHRDARFDADADLPRVYRILSANGHDLAALDRWAADEGITHVLHAPDVYARNILIGLSPPPTAYGDRAIFERWLASRGRVILASDEFPGASQNVTHDAEQGVLYELVGDSFARR